jgi:hypothetical protein
VAELISNGSVAPKTVVRHAVRPVELTADRIPTPDVLAAIAGIETARANQVRAAGPDGSAWSLKMQDGTVLGPVSLRELAEWAAESRVYPGHLCSADGSAWIPVERVHALGMEWMIEMEGGAPFGPLNVFAIAGLVTDGSVEPAARIVHVITKLAVPAGRIPTRQLLDLLADTEPLTGDIDTLRADLQSERELRKKLEEEVAALRDEVARLSSGQPAGAPAQTAAAAKPPPLSIKNQLKARLQPKA